MGIKVINPTSPGQRGMTKSDFAEITASKPEKSLLKPIRKTAGRNNTGRITCRHKGGGVKKRTVLLILNVKNSVYLLQLKLLNTIRTET